MEQKELSGVLFKNDKRTEEKHPHATGRCLIDGKEYYISAWRKTAKNGGEFTSLAFTPVVVTTQPAAEAEAVNNDGLPF